MIKIENIETYGWEAAIHGMRNPMNSWAKSDSNHYECTNQCNHCSLSGQCVPQHGNCFVVGKNDLKLMKTLVSSGTDHSKFMRMIGVSLDIVAPLYWWKEYDTYKVGTVANSCSTMHKIHDKEFTFDDFSHERLTEGASETMNDIILELNYCREAFLETKDKQYWDSMIQLLPTSYNQRRTVTLNYAVLRSMYHARRAHKLDEWREFCKWIEGLPYSELITE